MGPEPPGEEHRNFLAVMSSPELPEFLGQGPEPPGEEHRNFLAVMSSPELPEFLGQELPGNREN
uniref:Uncharacterized protein n=1 Tax=Oryza sativa subsp. japonica TaxID=39947 RepID=Q69KL5_ORYSJ|nr:hypothetical protein [Oryza sativa Japonica Group]BAD72466.1 hypothetical protein [Oryza sativa Japonica Group]